MSTPKKDKIGPASAGEVEIPAPVPFTVQGKAISKAKDVDLQEPCATVGRAAPWYLHCYSNRQSADKIQASSLMLPSSPSPSVSVCLQVHCLGLETPKMQAGVKMAARTPSWTTSG